MTAGGGLAALNPPGKVGYAGLVGGPRAEVEAAATLPVRAPAVEIRQQIDRFTVLDVLGRGGMGVVLSAHDPKLDRRVAIKLVHPGGRRAGETEEVRARLLREARAMARLRHPNVLTVHEAGEHEGQVYVAMEQIEGGTLRDELERRRAQGRPGWREIVSLFSEAGRGLAAAHEAGLIHRDFKPDNVLVDRDGSRTGRVVVADFGLVGMDEAPAGGDPAGDESPSGERLTAVDSVMGTPAYMPPEQHAGATLDARTDQFAFCVSLYEALYGELPFAGESRRDYLEAIMRGEVRQAPPGSRVPPWVREVLVRGMSADPELRYPSMDALLAEFAEESLELGFHWRVAGGAIVGLGCIGVVAALIGPPGELTYLDLQVSNTVAFAVTGLIFLVGRGRLLRSWLNRRLFYALVVAIMMVGFMYAGSSLVGLTPTQSFVMLGLIDAAMGAILAVSVEWRLMGIPIAYLTAFFAAALHPEIVAYALVGGHMITFANVIVVFVPTGRRRHLHPGPR